MNLKDKMEKFNKRWNIQTEMDYEDEFRKFKTRILNVFSDIDSHVPDESIEAFCNYYGIPKQFKYSEWGSGKTGKHIISRLNSEDNEQKFYELLEVIFSLKIHHSMGYDHRTMYSKEILLSKTKEALHFSNVNLSIGQDKDGDIIFHPRGEEILDEKLVNQILKSLDEKSDSHFVEALKFYQNKNWIKSAESIRRMLEEFLRYKLNNDKGFADNKLEIGKLLKEKKTDSQIRNIIAQIFGYLDQYFNDNSKHNDGELEEAENEFLIYQAGVLVNYLNKVL
jgi:hypothetical protein